MSESIVGGLIALFMFPVVAIGVCRAIATDTTATVIDPCGKQQVLEEEEELLAARSEDNPYSKHEGR